MLKILNYLLKAAPLRMWAIILGAPVLTVGAVLQTLLVWRGGWPETLAAQQLQIIGWSHLITISIIAVIIIALAAVRVKATGLAGTGLEVGGDDDAPTTPVTATATVTNPPAPKPMPTPGDEDK